VETPTVIVVAGEHRREAGFTMIEMIVTLAIASVLMAIATWGMHNYLIASSEAGTAGDVVSALRNAAEQSLSEGRTYCVYLTSSAWTVYRSDCTVAADKTNGPNQVTDTSVTLGTITFPVPNPPIANQRTACPVTGRCAYFYPRGTALAGGLQVTRPGKTYSISVEGLTGRVSVT
jgi:prepilin-type N-terminal cleavage/methylation domain-containing protein